MRKIEKGMIDGMETVVFIVKPYESIPELFGTKRHIVQVTAFELNDFCTLVAIPDPSKAATTQFFFPRGTIAIYDERKA